MDQPAQNPETPPGPSKDPQENTPAQIETTPKEALSLWTRTKKKIDAFLEHYITVSFMTIITLYALFADDTRQLIDNKNVDQGFYIFTAICLGLFLFEVFLSCIAKPGYFLGFFFWLDLISSASMILDIGWISDAIFGTGSGSSGAAGAAKLARAGRASRVGTRTARIIRIVRLIRLIRIVKLYKAAQTTLAQKPVFEYIEEEEGSDGTGTFGKATTSLMPGGKVPALQKEGTGSKESFGDLPMARKESLDAAPRKMSLDEPPVMRKDSMGETGSKKESAIELPTRKDSERKDSEIIKRQASIENLTHKKSLYGPGRKGEPKSIVSGPSRAFTSQLTSRGPRGSRDSNGRKLDIPQETNVGKKLSDLTTKRVITLVMSVMISIPIFSVDTYVSDFTSGESGLGSIWAMNQSGDYNAYTLAYNNYINEHKSIRDPMFVLNVLGDSLYSTSVTEDQLRDTEKQYYYIEGADEDAVNGYSCFDQRDDTHLNAILSIIRTFFVTGVLTAAALYFSKDSNDLVLTPIENMLVKVKRIAENPLAAAQIEEEDALLFERLEKEGKMKQFLKKKDEGNYETSILEKTILKLGALLALGFGEAGSDIIAQNMSKSGDVDPMIPGKKVMAIFGFCDIRQFTDATEVLQEGVMVFVNEIAEIVHGTINDFSGAANKNIGDAFLLVWKFPEDDVEVDPDDQSNLRIKPSIKVNSLADMSVISFLKVMASVNRSKKLDKYRHNENLNRRIKNFSVKMGFGLHVGWAIEGAIGSEFKIDASYLSPNVNMAARLEAATKQFGVPILISGALHKICSHETQKNLRHIDRVTVKGSIQPIDLYTCDVDFTKLTINQNEVDMATRTATEKKQFRLETRLRKEDMREKAFSGKVKVAKKFHSDKEISTMRKPFTKEFEDQFREGMENYISGNWSKARDLFEGTLKMLQGREKDGPSNTLLNYMSEFGYRAPHDWKGYRELTEK